MRGGHCRLLAEQGEMPVWKQLLDSSKRRYARGLAVVGMAPATGGYFGKGMVMTMPPITSFSLKSRFGLSKC
jgi:hypothetical protein